VLGWVVSFCANGRDSCCVLWQQKRQGRARICGLSHHPLQFFCSFHRCILSLVFCDGFCVLCELQVFTMAHTFNVENERQSRTAISIPCFHGFADFDVYQFFSEDYCSDEVAPTQVGDLPVPESGLHLIFPGMFSICNSNSRLHTALKLTGFLFCMVVIVAVLIVFCCCCCCCCCCWGC